MDSLEQLRRNLRHRDWIIRKQAALELGKTGFYQAVKPLLEALEDESSYVRKQAALSLGDFDDSRIFEPLVNKLREDESPQVRVAVVTSIAKSGDIRAVGILAEAFADNDIKVRREAYRAFRRKGSLLMEPLVRLLESDNPIARLNAVRLLAESKDARAFDPIVTKLKDTDINVRGEAARALGVLDDPRSFEPLVETLINGTEDIQWIAAKTLAGINDERAVEPLMKAVNSDSPRTARSAIEALGKMKAEKAVPYLCEILMKGNSRLEKSIVYALSKMGKASSEHILAAIGSGNEKAREALGDILKKMNDPLGEIITDFFNGEETAGEKLFELKDSRASIPLITALRNKDPEIRIIAINFLGKTKSKQTVDLIKGCLKDEDASVRLETAKSLNNLMGKKSGELLIELLNDSDEEIRLRMVDMLADMGIKVIEPLFEAYRKEKSNAVRNRLVEILEELVKLTHPFKDKYQTCFCPHCLRRFTEFKLKINFFKSLKYYGCRVCRGVKCIDEVGEVVALLDSHARHYLTVEDDVLLVDWLRKGIPVDFDRVLLVDASQKEILKFAREFDNDADNLNKGRKPVFEIGKNCKVSKKMENLLSCSFKLIHSNS